MYRCTYRWRVDVHLKSLLAHAHAYPSQWSSEPRLMESEHCATIPCLRRPTPSPCAQAERAPGPAGPGPKGPWVKALSAQAPAQRIQVLGAQAQRAKAHMHTRGTLVHVPRIKALWAQSTWTLSKFPHPWHLAPLSFPLQNQSHIDIINCFCYNVSATCALVQQHEFFVSLQNSLSAKPPTQRQASHTALNCPRSAKHLTQRCLWWDL